MKGLLRTVALPLMCFALSGCTRQSSEAAEEVKDAGKAVMESAKDAGEKIADETRAVAAAVEQATSDGAITAEVKMKFAKDKTVSAKDIRVNTDRGVVTLNGEVSSGQEAEEAVRMAGEVSGVRVVHSNLKVRVH